MAKVMQLPLVLLLTLSSLNSLTLAEQDCSAADIDLGKGELQNISTVDMVVHYGSVNLFVKTESDFEGISLNVQGGNGIQYAAWFPAEHKCFLHDDKWQQLQAWAEMNKDNISINFGLEIGKCMNVCVKNNVPRSLQKLNVVAYGFSKWIIKAPPNNCEITYLTSSNPPIPSTCKDPPSSTYGLSLMTIIIISLVGLLLVAGLVVAAVRARQKWKCVDPTESAGEEQTAEDDL